MKLRLFLILTITVMFLFALPVLAENLSSTNYKLVDPELTSSSGTSSSTNYKTLIQAGSGISFGQISSALYKVGSGQGYTFMANVPKITCFETSTNSGTTQCIGLPAGNGMIGECGETGCYDRAMLQLDVQGNPTDTIYSLQVSRDDWATVFVVDGTTRQLKPLASKTIADYKTKSQWESSPWNSYNIIGLKPNTLYKARATALHGNFTESEPGPSKTATTSLPSMLFDLDIGSDLSAESDAPYSSSLGVIVPETANFTSTQNVKLDVSTNAQSGVNVYVKDSYSGLRSTSTSYTLQSASEDLSNTASGDGFGLQKSGVTQSGSSLGFIVSSSTYDVSGSNVGAVSSSSQTMVLCTLITSGGTCGVTNPTWVTGGKFLLKLGTRATLNAPAKSDYSDILTFTITGAW